MNAQEFLILRQKLEKLIDGYHLKEVIPLIKSLDVELIPINLRSDFARLARRSHLYMEALKILQSVVYCVKRPETKDLLEYASCLRKIGMIQQCKSLLQRVPDCKEKTIYLAFCFVHEWDYSTAKDLFSQYLKFRDLSEHERVVAQLNWISCLVQLCEFPLAMQSIEQLMELCKHKYFQFYLNCLELKGQIYIKTNEHFQAQKVLNEAYTLANGEKGSTTLFIEKWLHVQRIAQTKKIDADAEHFKKIIREQGHWESLRDFEYQCSLYSENMTGLDSVYFASPFAEYRKKVCQETQKSFSKTHVWKSKDADLTKTFDPLHSAEEIIPFGHPQHRLLLLLLSDLYRPWTVHRIFDNLFKDEMFDPVSSPKRVYALIKKIQDSCYKNNLPFELLATTYGYRIRLKANGSILLYEKMVFSSAQEIIHYLLQEKFKTEFFAANEVSRVLPFSKHKIYRMINDLREANLLFKDEKSAKYKLKMTA